MNARYEPHRGCPEVPAVCFAWKSFMGNRLETEGRSGTIICESF